MAAIVSLCERIRTLVSPISIGHAEIAGQLGEAVQAGVAGAAELFNGLDWWGGSGSMADLIVPEHQKEYAGLLAQLVDLFRAEGVVAPNADRWAATFRDWIGRDIWSRLGTT